MQKNVAMKGQVAIHNSIVWISVHITLNKSQLVEEATQAKTAKGSIEEH